MGLNKLKNIGIIGISGKIGSGKDSFAEIFATLSPIKVERHAFADNVKKITEQLVGHPMSVTHELNKPFANVPPSLLKIISNLSLFLILYSYNVLLSSKILVLYLK